MVSSTENSELDRQGVTGGTVADESSPIWRGYRVKLDQFEGPLDLLLFLIKKNEIDIYDIPLAVITGQYLIFLDGVEYLDLDRAGDYLLMAATLMSMKARTLLPGKETIYNEEEELTPEEELSLRLIEYQTFREVSRRLSEAASSRMKLHTRGNWLIIDDEYEGDEPDFKATPEVSINEMLRAFSKLIYTLKPREGHRVRLSAFSVEEKTGWIRNKLSKEEPFEFLSLFRGIIDREELVVTFIALLELINLGEAKVTQRGNFRKLVISKVVRSKK